MTMDFKTATPEELRAEYQRLAKLTGDDQFFTRKELAHLPEVLAQGEPVLGFCSGFMDASTWLIALTDRRVLFLDKGFLFGMRQVSIDLDKINAVTGSTRLLLGQIEVEDGARNRIINNVPKRTVIAFTNLVRDAMEARKRPPAPVIAPPLPASPVKDDILDQLERLGALHRDGVLTADEFAGQKARILAGA
jgi:hypothetical protein